MNKGYVRILKNGGVGVFATDTIYGILGSALMPRTVARIYRLRRRNKKKPLIVLVGSISALGKFGIRLTPARRAFLRRVWPGKVSVILPCGQKKFTYLHRGTKTLAFRLPASVSLRTLLMKTGPLVAPSANPEGEKPAATIARAKKYFGKSVDFYHDSGRKDSAPSTLVDARKGTIVVLRRGSGLIK